VQVDPDLAAGAAEHNIRRVVEIFSEFFNRSERNRRHSFQGQRDLVASGLNNPPSAVTVRSPNLN
jgi:hypothetical protein